MANALQQQLESQRQSLAQQRLKAEQATKQLAQARARLPQITQRALRGGAFAGLRGVGRRAEVRKAETQIEAQKRRVGEFEKALTTFEIQRLKPAEAQLQKAQEYKQAIKTLRRAATQGRVGAYAMYGEGIIQQLAKEYVKQLPLDREHAEFMAAKAATEALNISDISPTTLPGVSSQVQIPGITQPPMSIDPYQALGLPPPKTVQEIFQPPKVPGLPMSIAPELVVPTTPTPTFAEMIGLPPTPLDIALQKPKAPVSIDPYQALGLPPPKPLPEFLQKPATQFQAEKQRYQDIGYTSSEARKLATESLKLGGVSFTPARAADIIVGPLGTQTAREKLGAEISERIKKLAVGTGELLGRAFEVSKPMLEKEFKIPLGLGVKIPTGVTRAEVVAFPSVFARRAAELSGEGWEDIYRKTIGQLPQEWKPSKILPGKEEEYLTLLEDLRTGRIKRKDVSFEGLVIPVTPEEVGRVAEVGAELALFGAAAVVGGPVAVGTLLTSDVVSAQQDYIGAPEEALKEAEKLFKEHLKTKLGPGEKHLTETEFIKEISPSLEEGIKRQALIEGGTSLAFLGAGAGAKLLGAGAKVVGAEGKLIALQESKVIDRTIGFTKKNGDITQIVVKTKRKIKGAESETTTMFNVRKTGDKTFQVEKGTGVQQITLDRPFRKPLKIEEPFTFAGPVEEVVGRKVIQRQVSEQGLKSLKEELKGVDVTVGDLRIVFGKKDLTVIKKSFFGISPKVKKKIEITRDKLKKEIEYQPFIGGELEKVIKPKVDVLKVIEKPVGIGKPTEIGILIEAPKVPVKPKIITITGVPPKPPKELLAEKLIRQIDEGIKIPTPGIDKVIDIGRKRALLKLEEKIIGKGIVGITAEKEALKVARMKLEPPKFVPPKVLHGVPTEKIVGVEEVTLVTDVTTLPPVIKPTFIAEVSPKPPTTPPKISIELPKIKVKERVDTFQVPTLTTAQRIEISEKVKPKPVTRVEAILREKIRPAFKPIFKSVLAVRPKAKAKVLPVSVIAKPKPKVKPKIKPLVIPKIKGRPVTKTPTKPMPGQEGYGYEIRRKGKWQRVNLPFAFATPEGAEAKAMTQVQREAAASFRLVKSKKPVRKSFRKPTALQKVLFRPGKEKGVMVQKKLLRITTPGEVRQISLVGAAARRKQVKKKVKKKAVKKKVKRKVPKKTKRRKKK